MPQPCSALQAHEAAAQTVSYSSGPTNMMQQTGRRLGWQHRQSARALQNRTAPSSEPPDVKPQTCSAVQALEPQRSQSATALQRDTAA